MRKLLRANFARLWKSRIFWLCVAAMAVQAIGVPLSDLEWVRDGETVYAEYGMFSGMPMTCVVLAAFCSLFIGADYADGTLRNRLIVGNGRGAIYMANLLTCAAAGALFFVAYALPAAALGKLLLSGFGRSAAEIGTLLLISLAATVSASALFCMGAMLVNSRAASVAALLLVMFVMILGSSMIQARLDEQPVQSEGIMVNDQGIVTEIEERPNADYLSGTKRAAFQFLADCLPTGQSIQISNLELSAGGEWKLPLYSLGIVLFSSAAGLALFRKKDIK